MSGISTGGWSPGRKRGTGSSASGGDLPRRRSGPQAVVRRRSREACDDMTGRADMRRVWTWALTGLAPWLLPAAAAAEERGYEWGWGVHPMWGVWGLGIGLMMLGFWGAVIVGIVVGVRW